MFTGDNVLGVGTSVFRDLDAYMKSLQAMRDAVSAEGLNRLYPAHGPVVDAAVEKIDEYLLHRHGRIAQILAVLQAASGAWTCEEVTRNIYADLNDSLIRAAMGNTLLVLRKLEADGRVHSVDPSAALEQRRWRATAAASPRI